MSLRIAALIPTFNRRVHVCRAIDSVLAQTHSPEEIIVVDDGSTDGTAEAIRSQYGSRVTLIQQANRGVSSARSRAVEAATCDWVAFLDSDDVWKPEKLATQAQALRSMGPKFGACFTNCDYAGNPEKNLTVFDEAGLEANGPFGPVPSPMRYIVGQLGILIQSVLVERSLVVKVGSFDEALGISEDRDLVLKLSLETNFCYVSAPLVTIDRSPELARLTGRLNHKTDESYGCMELLLQRMLVQSELEDPQLHTTVQNELISLYYAWARERIGGLRFKVALQKIGQIRSLGHGSGEIAHNLFSSAGQKIARALGSRNYG